MASLRKPVQKTIICVCPKGVSEAMFENANVAFAVSLRAGPSSVLFVPDGRNVQWGGSLPVGPVGGKPPQPCCADGTETLMPHADPAEPSSGASAPLVSP